MPLYQINGDTLTEVEKTTFIEEGLKERSDIQKLLVKRIEILSEDLMFITEEFGDWEDSKRRIDILAIDREANLVVIEIKRTQDGGHMELQALRYAAMISTMTFEQVVMARSNYLQKQKMDIDPETEILSFLGWSDPDEEKFGNNIRIILASNEFSKEVTTSVLWLNSRDLDITCIRLQLYKLNGQIVVDLQQIIPLPEAEEYQVKVKEKDKVQRSKDWQPRSLPEIWRMMEQNCPREIYDLARKLYDWIQPVVTEVFSTRNGFAAKAKVKGIDYYMFKVTVNGDVQFWFQYLSTHEPFTDLALRKKLQAKLNEIPGVHIADEKLSGKPRFPLEVLKTEVAFSRFRSTIEWMLQRMAV